MRNRVIRGCLIGSLIVLGIWIAIGLVMTWLVYM